MKRRLLILLACLCAFSARAQILVLKTDAAMDLLTTPNIGAELVCGDKVTVGAQVYYTPTLWGQDVHQLGAIPEVRYWLSSTPFDRLFVGAAAVLTRYDVGLGNEMWKGNAYGGGLTFGYAFPLSRYHWTAEVSAGISLLRYSHHHQWKHDFLANDKPNGSGLMVMPFRVGFTICYVWPYKNEKDSKHKWLPSDERRKRSHASMTTHNQK